MESQNKNKKTRSLPQSSRQALNALVFLYRDVLDEPLVTEIAFVRSKHKQKPRTALTQAEVQQILAAMTGKHA